MKRFGIWVLAVMLGLVLACGSEEKKAPAKTEAPPAKIEKTAPTAPAPPAAQQPKPDHPKSEPAKPEHPKSEHPK